MGHGPFPSYINRLRLDLSDIWQSVEKEDPLHYATSCHHRSSFPFTKPSAENTLLWWTNLLLNKLSRVKIAKLISFLTDDEHLMKQQPVATSSSNSDPNFSPSPRPQTNGPLPSRDSKDPNLSSYKF
ncbi:hypothetical protein AVEN_124407-1 [Araneus ventricosus]|uniref:Uncharacterized protein n=1 Tax=Araneus ventricosus TaxID=182803 RepID=A0A4Y2MBH3_ARAVE|nr:hypothetical protein AVEN_124407-1 [Araneus ventricosus]